MLWLGLGLGLGLGFDPSSPIVRELVLSLTRLSFPLVRFRHNPLTGPETDAHVQVKIHVHAQARKKTCAHAGYKILVQAQIQRNIAHSGHKVNVHAQAH